MKKVIICLVAVLAAIVGCSGGGGGAPAAPNTAPVAEAGPVAMGSHSGATVILDGTGSTDGDLDPLSYTWSVVGPSPSTPTFTTPNSANASITTKVGEDGIYTITLTVDDSYGGIDTDTITLTTTANLPPVADAGPDQNIPKSTITPVTLDGSLSSDPNLDVLTYAWTFTASPGPTPSLSSAIDVAPTFIADLVGTYTLDLLVNDGTLNSLVADSVSIVTTNTTPVANAGSDQSVALGGTATLDGSGSTDANGDALTENWTITAVPAASAVVPPVVLGAPTFVPDVSGTYTVQLIVNDGAVDSSTDTMVLAVFFFIPLPDTGQTGDYTGISDDGEDSDYTINPPSYTDNGDGTVTDDVTGLIWQKADNNPTYNWYEASGTLDATHNSTPIDVCGDLVLDGQTDWRLPTKKELVSILDLGTSSPAIDSTAFSSTNFNKYWSSTLFFGDPVHVAWSVDFMTGGAYFWDKTPTGAANNVYVRCVRGQGSSGPLIDNGDSTVTDTKTGLMWQQVETGASDWPTALALCENETLAGYDDWRLPNFKELESLSDDGRFNPAISGDFPSVDIASPYWSSSSEHPSPSSAWAVYFYSGLGESFFKGNPYNARCVR